MKLTVILLYIAQPQIAFYATGKAVESEPYQAQCTASIPNVHAANLMQYLNVEWVGPGGQRINPQRDGITVAVARNVIPYSLSKSLVFDPFTGKTHSVYGVHGRPVYRCQTEEHGM